jgi:hypothetical protein
MNSRLLQAARVAMPDDLSLQGPTITVDGIHRGDARAAASWLVPPVVLPIFLVTSIVAYALYRLAHFGLAAFG